MTNFKRPLKALATGAAGVPFLGDALHAAYRRRFNAAAGDARMFCGIYEDFRTAEHAIPANRLLGYDNPQSAERMMAEWLGVFPSDYPVLFWLQKLLPGCETLFDWGGNVGIKYFAFRPYLEYPPELRWIVQDVPAVLRRGGEIAAREGAPQLSFQDGMDALAEAQVLLASGVVQFVEDPFARLAAARSLPGHLIFNKVPAYGEASRVTLHNMGTALCPYHLFNRDEFVSAIEALGYELRDEWPLPDVRCEIPFLPRYAIPAYAGYYFTAAPGRGTPRAPEALLARS